LAPGDTLLVPGGQSAEVLPGAPGWALGAVPG
jgi:hypothetical protein